MEATDLPCWARRLRRSGDRSWDKWIKHTRRAKNRIGKTTGGSTGFKKANKGAMTTTSIFKAQALIIYTKTTEIWRQRSPKSKMTARSWNDTAMDLTYKSTQIHITGQTHTKAYTKTTIYMGRTRHITFMRSTAIAFRARHYRPVRAISNSMIHIKWITILTIIDKIQELRTSIS